MTGKAAHTTVGDRKGVVGLKLEAMALLDFLFITADPERPMLRHSVAVPLGTHDCVHACL